MEGNQLLENGVIEYILFRNAQWGADSFLAISSSELSISTHMFLELSEPLYAYNKSVKLLSAWMWIIEVLLLSA